MKQIRLIAFILFACSGKIFSQQSIRFHTTYYTTEDGLPSNGIKGLQWDEQTGFLWIATEAGVSRFNGLDFTNFTIENTPFIESERMLFMVKNNKGKIYTADQSGNILTIKNNRLVLHQRVSDMQKDAYKKRFLISISDTFFNDQSLYIASRPFSLLSDYNLPTSDTSAFIFFSNRVYFLRMGMKDAEPYGDSN
jgi:hypothetical protein